MGFVGGNLSDMLEKAPDRMSGGLGGYVPGATPNKLPGDLARLLPAHSNIVMQTHFHPTGKPEVEQGELAIYFTNTAPAHRLQSVQLPAVFGVGAGINVPQVKRTIASSTNTRCRSMCWLTKLAGMRITSAARWKWWPNCLMVST